MRLRRLQAPARALWERARRRALKRGLEFSINRDAIFIPATCPAFGIPIRIGDARSDNSPSLDRVDASRGYVAGNVRVISDRANRLKGDRSLDELRLRAAIGTTALRRDYALLSAYVERELLLQQVLGKAETGGRAGEEWATIASHLGKIFQRRGHALSAMVADSQHEEIKFWRIP
jgi:hypothetical protein